MTKWFTAIVVCWILVGIALVAQPPPPTAEYAEVVEALRDLRRAVLEQMNERTDALRADVIAITTAKCPVPVKAKR